MTPESILIADDDADSREFVRINLALDGYEVLQARDGEEALWIAREKRPDLILLDAMMPKVDGFEVTRRLRSDIRTFYMAIIILTARSLPADRVAGLTIGADDYIIKPFDPVELSARVWTTLRRAKDMRDLNPLTGLPGNSAIQRELQKRVEAARPFALMYVDLDNFKAFNDCYGFARGDGVLRFLAAVLQDTLIDRSPVDSFVGHIGGDDFSVMCVPDNVRSIGEKIIDEFDKGILGHYDEKDRERGSILVTDRQDNPREFPIMSVSIGVASSAQRRISSHWEASEIATETKRFAKRTDGSILVFDRRTRDRAS